ncbi:hypothetical protein GCM10010517_65560 [Streptosporangium fragile]|uniref:Non-ribosomal peptide synthetase n=1 Tax=Streptosporangium fragile TaxID=46186 RepID=A0ABP6IMQ9_9ACTN
MTGWRVLGPDRKTTLLDVLLEAAEKAPEQVIVHVRDDGSERVVTVGGLRDESMGVAGGYLAAGVEPGSCVLLLADRSDDFQPMFWGALAAGLIPVPLAPEANRVLPVWESLDRPPVVVDEATAHVLDALPGIAHPLRLTELRGGHAPARLPAPAPEDAAFLQFSSGSTGTPKGVELTHAGVLANLEQIRIAAALTADDVVVSWMPYFHDMGLIGTHLAPLAAGLKQVKLGPLSFAKRPALWFEVAARHRATLLSAANFALSWAARRVPDEVLTRLDLSSVRLVFVGAEPITATACREFTRKLGPAGLDERALLPVYGLAEATLAVTFPPLGEVAAPLVLDRAALSRGRAEDAAPGPDGVELMDVGHPLPGCAVRIVDDGGRRLGDRRVGHIEVRGPQVARGYHRSPEATAAAFAGGWLRTGDMGFLRDGRLCVTGRHKDVVFVNGRTFHAPDIEEVAAGTPGLPPGLAAVVGSTDPVGGGERVVVFVQWARPPRETVTGVLDRVASRVGGALAHDDVLVLPLPPGAFPRTTSGKLQRSLMRTRFEAGRYAELEARLAASRASSASSVPPVAPASPAVPIAPAAPAAPAVPAAPAASASAATDPPRTPAAASVRPRGEVEGTILGIWARVLGRPEAGIGLHDRFLAIGGSSLKAMEVLAALEDVFGVTVPPAVLRDCDTVAALTDRVLALGGELTAPAPRAAGTGAPERGAAAVAVIGMACRFPGADTPEAFWARLAAGHDAVTGVPAERWTTPPDAVARWGAFLDDPAGFDAEFFRIGEDEARATDPQARLFLELAHEALERAGYAGHRRRDRRVGVFAAVGENGYREVLTRAAQGRSGPPEPALVGNLPNLVAARVAQSLDLTGPALAVDTACSSALVALHLARRSLQAGECDIAVVGGVNLNLTPTGYRLLEAVQALSPTGRCRAFSADADGFVPGEGGAVIVLARLDDARRADDPVLALLRGTAVNNDGRSLSLMAPNPLRQREVIVQAYRDAGIDPGSVSYVEAHGTGTAIGDPVEVRSLAHAFPPRTDGRPRWLGSVKTNLGHLLNAAGMPGLVKVVLALTHRQLPASLHHEPLSPKLDLTGAGFAVVTEHRDWTAPGPLVAGVNAFGFGGTNAHAILEEAPPRPARPSSPADGRPQLLTLSAHSASALRAAASDLAAHLRAHPELDGGDVCAAVRAARDDGPHRLAVATYGVDLATRLEAGPAGTPVRSRPRLVFLLPGQGAQRPGQARALYRVAPVFREVLEEASALTGPVRGRSLAAWCLDPGVPPAALARTEVAQPLLVAFGIALARQLQAWGITPDAVAGHSVGEIAGGCVSGALTLADAVRFAADRGRLMGELAPPGAMAAVGGTEETVAGLVAASGGTLHVAAVNGPAQVVIAGAPDVVDRAVAELGARGVPARRLAVSHAFHSPLMRPALDPLAAAAGALTFRIPPIPLLSSVTAEWQPTLDRSYLREHAIRPVRFGAAVGRLLDDGYDTFVELGPGSTLPGPVRAAARERGAESDVFAAAVAGNAQNADSGRALLETVGLLWARGAELDHAALDAGRGRVAVPTYPFQRRRFWPRPATAPLLHRLAWDDAPPAAGDGPRAVWLAGPDCALGRALADRLTGRGVPVHRATGTPPAGTPPPDVVVLLAGAAPDPDDVASLDAAQRTAVTALRDLLTLLGPARPQVLLVTEDVHATGAAPERLRPAQALLTGFALALPEELPGLAARSVDLSSLDGTAAHLDALDRELDTRDAPGRAGAIAWRAGRRLARTPVAAVAGPPSPPLPPDGTYLITGGAGGVGAALARDLAGRGRPALVLCGRSAQPPAALLSELEALGATVEYRVADVSREDDVDALISGLPPLDAVFHAAGVARPGTLRSKSPDEMGRVLAAKVRGSYLLARSLRRHGHRPSVCVAFSSIVSVLPGLAGALGDYAAGNAFLDAFAAAERAAGRPWQSLNFAAFAGTGLAAGLRGRAGLPARWGTALATDAALEAMRVACGLGAAQLLIADLTGDPAPAAARPAGPASTAPAAAPPDTTGILRRLLAEALRLPPGDIADDTPFLGMGLDSLTAVDLVKKLEREVDRPLPATLFFEYQTVRELVDHLQTGPVGGTHAAGEPPTAGDGGSFPLTPVQLAFHTNERLHRQVTAYGYVRQTINGALDTELLGQAFAFLAERHPMLRIRIEPGGAAPRQTVAPPSPVAAWYEVRDVRGRVEDLEETLCNRPFDLAVEPPVRVVLARENADVAHLILVIHHAAGDGFSLNVLGEELWSAYTALSQGRTPAPEPPGAGFADYAAALEAERASAAFTEDQRYWREMLAAHSAPLSLPYDGDPDAPPAPPLATRQVAVDPALTAALRERAAAHGVSLFHLLLAAYARCLARWSGRSAASPDTPLVVPVNVARARRETRLPGIDRLVGPLADTLPVFATVVPGESPLTLAGRLRQAWLAGERHARLTSLDLARLLPARGAGPRTVSPASFSFARFPATHDPGCPVTVRVTAAGTASAATRLGLLCWETDRSLHFSWNFPARLFARTTVERLAREHLDELTGRGRPGRRRRKRRRRPRRRGAGSSSACAPGSAPPPTRSRSTPAGRR